MENESTTLCNRHAFCKQSPTSNSTFCIHHHNAKYYPSNLGTPECSLKAPEFAHPNDFPIMGNWAPEPSPAWVNYFSETRKLSNHNKGRIDHTGQVWDQLNYQNSKTGDNFHYWQKRVGAFYRSKTPRIGDTGMKGIMETEKDLEEELQRIQSIEEKNQERERKNKRAQEERGGGGGGGEEKSNKRQRELGEEESVFF